MRAARVMLALVVAGCAAAGADGPVVTEPAPPGGPPEVPRLPAWSAELPPDEGLLDADRDAIQHEAHFFMSQVGDGDVRRRELLGRLRDPAGACGRAHAAALAGAFTAGIEPSLVAETVDQAKTSCAAMVVESAGFATRVDATLAAALEARTHADDEAVRRAAWLAYGSIAETARRTGAPDAVADDIDRTLARRLDRARGDELLLFVRAAGNAGCAPCAPRLARLSASTDMALRRAATASLRFLVDDASVSLMCQRVLHDRDDGVRDLAAWSLEWRTTQAAVRVDCLERAARGDASQRVRTQSVLALGILANDVGGAASALTRIAARDDDTGALATSTLVTRSTPEPAFVHE